MYLYIKTIKTKNTAGKITALLSLLCGAALFILAGGGHIAMPAVAQTAGIILLTLSIYVATAYLLREYTYKIQFNNKVGENLDMPDKYDFVIIEKKSNREIKVCHVGMNEIDSFRIVDKNNKKQVRNERREMKRYTYNSEYAPSRYIEICATIDDEKYSILITYDEDLLKTLKEF